MENAGMSKEPESGWQQFKNLAATYGVMLAIAGVVAFLAWISTFWSR
jgi:hypothetical protein